MPGNNKEQHDLTSRLGPLIADDTTKPPPRWWLHKGAGEEHHSLDRAGFTAIRRLLAQSYSEAADWEHDCNVTNNTILQLLQWDEYTPCSVHDIHNGMKWSLFVQFRDKDLMRNAHITIASLRQSYDLLLGHVAEWALKNINLAEPLSADEVDELRMLWDCLGILPEVADLLVTLELRWTGGALNISRKCVEHDDLLGSIVTSLLTVWKFKQFTDSRWVTVGESTRTIIAGLLTGLDGLAQMLLSDDHVSKFYLNGWSRMSPDLVAFMTKAAMVSRISDAVLLELMADARVPRTLATLQRCLAEEMEWICGVHDSVWVKLGSLSDTAPQRLRDECIAAAHTTIAFFTYRVIVPASQLPWSLTIGDMNANLDALALGPKPPERTATKIWTLCKMGYNRGQLLKGLILLAECLWGTVAAEQFHASAATLMRLHPEYGVETLMARALLLQINRLMHRAGDEEKSMLKLQKKLFHLQQKQPEQLRAHNLFVQDLHTTAKNYKWSEQRPKPKNLAKTILKKAVAAYKLQPLATKQKYNARTAVAISAKGKEISDDIDSVHADMSLRTQRTEQANASTKPMTMNAAVWTDMELDLFKVLHGSTEFSRAHVRSLREQARQAPPVPTAARLTKLAANEPDFCMDYTLPAWAAGVCKQREHFSNVTLVLRGVLTNEASAHLGTRWSTIVEYGQPIMVDHGRPLSWSIMVAQWKI